MALLARVYVYIMTLDK